LGLSDNSEQTISIKFFVLMTGNRQFLPPAYLM